MEDGGEGEKTKKASGGKDGKSGGSFRAGRKLGSPCLHPPSAYQHVVSGVARFGVTLPCPTRVSRPSQIYGQQRESQGDFRGGAFLDEEIVPSSGRL